MVELGRGNLRLPLGEDLVVGHVHARQPPDAAGSSHSPRVKRRIRAKTSLAELERKERGRSRVPEPPRLRTLARDPAEVPIFEGSLVPASSPTSGINRAHPYTPVGGAVGSSSFEMVPSVRDRAASDRGLNESMETVPIVRANSSPSSIQDPSQKILQWKIGLVFFLLAVPARPESGFVFLAYGCPHRKRKRQTVSEKTSTVSQKDASLFKG